MAKYMIHAVPKRMWYVEDFLVPSMLEQGIDKDNIIVYNDSEHLGNLKACMKSFSMAGDDDGGTWHLQDDTLICKKFKILTESLDFGLVCGFSSEMYDGPGRIGAISVQDMWFSFPCIRIPNQYARECSEWVNTYIIGNPVYKAFWEKGVNDDWAFRSYLREFHKKECAINLAPNLVNHIDYLIGGGTGKGQRKNPVTAQYWTDDDLVEKLEKALSDRYKK